jgi:hypothetical protein
MSSTEHLNPQTPYSFTTQTMRDFSHKAVRKNTNPRYKHFKQTFFTAGDREQFETFRDDVHSTHGGRAKPRLYVDTTCCDGCDEKREWTHDIDPIYNTRISRKDVSNTFKYIFFKFKKGIYIKIRNNTLETFLPFSNVNFINEYAHKLTVREKGNFRDLISFLKKTSKYPLKAENVNRQVDTWFANNSLVRHEYPVAENDTNIPAIKDMFVELLRARKIGDVDLFVNKRDNPILAEGKYEPYNHLFDSCTHPLVSHKYAAYAPILSMSKSNRYSDILFPTVDDWIRVRAKEGRFFPRASNDYFPFPEQVSWHKKKTVALWRGSSTGVHITSEKNKRMKLAKLAQRAMLTSTCKDVPIDAGITSWKLRPRKIQGVQHLQTIDVSKTGIRLVQPISFASHTNYKYLIDIEGHVAAYRLGALLGLGSVVLSVESEFSLWFSKYLRDGVHFVAVKSDLSDLQEKLNWLKEHDSEAQKIAENGRAFFQKYLCKEGILNFLSSLLNEISMCNKTSDWRLVSPLPTLRQSRLADSLCSTSSVASQVEKVYVNNHRSFVFLAPSHKVVKVALTPSAVKELYNEKRVYDVLSSYKKYCKNWLLGDIVDSGVNHENKPASVFEEIRGETLLEWICGPSFCPEKLLVFIEKIVSFTKTLCLLCNFVHYDLVPGNIVLENCENPKIIDLGKSRIAGDSGNVFASSPLRTQVLKNQDAKHLLLACLYHVIRRKDASRYKRFALDLFEKVNHIRGRNESTSRHHSGVRVECNWIAELKAETKRACKYSNLLNSTHETGESIERPQFQTNRIFNFPQKDAVFLIDYIWNKIKSNIPSMTYSELLRVREEVVESKIEFDKAKAKFQQLISTDFQITKHELVDLLFFVKNNKNQTHIFEIYEYFSILLEIKNMFTTNGVEKKNYSFT